jgi:hypothetical protein
MSASQSATLFGSAASTRNAVPFAVRQHVTASPSKSQMGMAHSATLSNLSSSARTFSTSTVLSQTRNLHSSPSSSSSSPPTSAAAAVDPEVKPHRLSSLYIHHAASYDRGISPADAPSYYSTSFAATAAARPEDDDMVTVPARLATAAAFLAPRALSAYRVVGSQFVHPAQRAPHAVSSAGPRPAAAADDAAMHRSSLDDAVENAFFGTHDDGGASQDTDSLGKPPSVDSKYAGHIMADPDTKAAIQRAQRERAKAEAAEREMQVWPCTPTIMMQCVHQNFLSLIPSILFWCL